MIGINTKEEISYRKFIQASPIYVNKSDILYRYAKKMKPIAGYDVVVCHADKFGFVFKDSKGKEIELSVSEFAKIIKTTPTYKDGDIRLIACEVGFGNDSIANGFAKQMNVRVMAATEIVNVNQDGEFLVSNNEPFAELWNMGHEVQETGKWVIIDPNE